MKQMAMGCVQQRGSTQSKCKVSNEEFGQVKNRFLSQIQGMIRAHQITPELVLNWDQSDIRLLPLSNWTMEEQGSKRVAIEGLNDKLQITSTLTVTLSGEFLPLQLLYTGKQVGAIPHMIFLPSLTSFILQIIGLQRT